MELILPSDRIGIILDNDDVVRGTIRGTDNNKGNIQLLEECLGNEYGGEAKIQKIEYFNHNDTYQFTAHIWDVNHTTGGPPDIWDFFLQKAVLYERVVMINCFKCKEEQEATQRFCVNCGNCLT
jgi:hypothetical protein